MVRNTEAIQGLWRIVRGTLDGHKVGDNTTHEVFEWNTWREIDPVDLP